MYIYLGLVLFFTTLLVYFRIYHDDQEDTAFFFALGIVFSFLGLISMS